MDVLMNLETIETRNRVDDFERQLFSDEEKRALDPSKIPLHIAIIPDGNRRYAKSHSLPIESGHIHGTEALITCIAAAKQLGIKTLTVFGLSTENWARPIDEVIHLIHIFETYFLKGQKTFQKENIRFRTIGNTSTLPNTLKKIIKDTEEITKENKDFEIVLAINYGGRDELCRAVQKISHDVQTLKLNAREISEATISAYLDTRELRDPDLLIRTSGEKRISNFLLWQTSYTEVYTEDVPWPEFTPQHLLQAIVDYQNRNRRKGF